MNSRRLRWTLAITLPVSVVAYLFAIGHPGWLAIAIPSNLVGIYAGVTLLRRARADHAADDG